MLCLNSILMPSPYEIKKMGMRRFTGYKVYFVLNLLLATRSANRSVDFPETPEDLNSQKQTATKLATSFQSLGERWR